jgi:hypothetical protein
MAMLEMLSEMVGTIELFAAIAFPELMHML